jgi:hypothetical protein
MNLKSVLVVSYSCVTDYDKETKLKRKRINLEVTCNGTAVLFELFETMFTCLKLLAKVHGVGPKFHITFCCRAEWADKGCNLLNLFSIKEGKAKEKSFEHQCI